MTENVDISGLDKAEVLAALFNASRPQRMGFHHPHCLEDLTVASAQEILEGEPRFPWNPFKFDYVNGRPLKVDLRGDTFDPTSFDENNGEGAAARAVEALRK